MKPEDLKPEDLQLLAEKGIGIGQMQAQLNAIATGFPYLEIKAPATPGNGITVLSADEQKAAEKEWGDFLNAGGTVCKFVPASGAASRMFKSLFSFVDGEDPQPKEGSDVAQLIANIHNVAFFSELNETCKNLYGKSVDEMLAANRAKEVVAAIISAAGMNYGNLPKGLLTFHRDGKGGVRTPVDEQIEEGMQSARQSNGEVNLHMTVSGNHRDAFTKKLAKAVPAAESETGCKLNVSLSEQHPSTDTIAANPDGTPFRDENGKPVFRPGGHGALIRNLNDIHTDVIFIKNIDNVVPAKLRETTLKYKKVIAGYLVGLQKKVSAYVKLIDERNYTESDLSEICGFLKEKFSFDSPAIETLEGEDLSTYLRTKLNRPLRVCGMVKNEGEPGGGPFIAVNPDGSESLQILESSQIDLSVSENQDMMRNATHFNPVDLVCYVKDAYGHHFNLPDYVDPQTGFISSKSLHGRELKALELPGLWNGAMSDWLTAFVEVPVETFNPVKTVNDLLRPQHQG